MKSIIDYKQPKITGKLNRDLECFRGLAFHNGYLEYPLRDNSAISVGFWKDCISVKPHKHAYYEFALIKKGSCTHNYEGTSVSLVPGDVFLVTPHREHSYDIQADMEIYNCNFIAEGLGEDFNVLLDDLFCGDSKYKNLRGNWSKQRILHLASEHLETVEYHLRMMMEEQKESKINLEHAKTAHLQLILIYFQRLLLQYEEKIEKYTDQRKAMIRESVSYLEDHLDERIDFDEMARRHYVSIGYFRTIFKDIVGMRPVEYLNQIRVIKSLEFLGNKNYSVTEVGQKVGFPDPNYYSRIFKKIMGYSPRDYKNMQEMQEKSKTDV